MVGQVHLRKGEPPHALQGRITGHGGELVLPGLDLQDQIRDRRRGGHRMAPEAPEPLHMPLHLGIAGQEAQGFGDVMPPHLLHTPEQGAGVVEHDARAAAAGDQLGDQLRHAPVAVGKGLGVVVIALVWMLQHELEMGDQRSISASGNRGLMHVQCTGKSRAKVAQGSIGVAEPIGIVALHQRLQLRFSAADRRQRLRPTVGVEAVSHGPCVEALI